MAWRVPETFAVSATGRIVAHTIGGALLQQLDAAIAAARSGYPEADEQGRGVQGFR
jgi:hypothetical protein